MGMRDHHAIACPVFPVLSRRARSTGGVKLTSESGSSLSPVQILLKIMPESVLSPSGSSKREKLGEARCRGDQKVNRALNSFPCRKIDALERDFWNVLKSRFASLLGRSSETSSVVTLCSYCLAEN